MLRGGARRVKHSSVSSPPQLDDPAREKTRVLLVDDHPLVRERLSEVINREPDLTVCGEAEDRHEALKLVAESKPHLVMVDVTLKSSNGLDLIRDLHGRWPHLRILVVSMHEETLYAVKALQSGAHGYITKQEATRNILQAIRRILGGKTYLNAKIAAQILGQLGPKNGTCAESPAALLADREMQVFELTGRGLNTRQIAARLGLGVKTVETYRARIRDKLKLRNPEDLLPVAIEWTHRTSATL